MTQQVAMRAQDVGIDMQFDSMVPTHTHDAHRLAQLAKEQGVLHMLNQVWAQREAAMDK